MSEGMPEHDHDDDGNCILPENGFYATQIPVWRFSGWDVAGIVAHTAGGLLSTVGNGLGLLARECSAMANWTRQTYDIRKAEEQRQRQVAAYEAHQREMAAELARITGLAEPAEGES